MVRTQIQLPDDVFAKAKQLCETREISFAELARRGIEYILSVYSQDLSPPAGWQPPAPRSLGWQGLSEARLKEEAQLTDSEIKLGKKSG